MKTFITITGVAILAIVLVEFSLTSAHRQGQGQNRRCRGGRRPPPLNTTEVKCEQPRRPGQVFQAIRCLVRCVQCYNQTQLNRVPACLVNGKCQCLGKPGGANGTEPTTEVPGDLTTGGDSTQPENPGSDQTTLPSAGGSSQAATGGTDQAATGGTDQAATGGTGQGNTGGPDLTTQGSATS